MEPSSFYKEWEELYRINSEELYNQYAGLDVNRERMEKAAKDMIRISKDFLQHHQPENRKLKHGLIESIVNAEQASIRHKLRRERNRKISGKKEFKGKKVNWGNWRQFNSQAEPDERKLVFDEFVQKVSLIRPIIEEFFEIARKAYAKYHTTALEKYLEWEDVRYEDLHRLLEMLGDGAKSQFMKTAEKYAQELFGKPFDYYDDMYVFRSRVYKPLKEYFADLKNPIKSAKDVFGRMGLDLSKVDTDDADRPGKTPSPVCFYIQIPDDVRILYRQTDPFEDTSSVFHEMGHAIHGVLAQSERPIWNRYFTSIGVDETFSILFEHLVENPLVLGEVFRFDEDVINDVINRRHFMNLWFLVFYAANSILKLEYWKNNLSIDEASNRYEELTKRFFHKLPGEYWLLHHVMPNYNLYSPSYVIASVRAAELEQLLERDYGSYWWKTKKAGKFLEELMSQRSDIDLSWSRLDPQSYLDRHAKLP
ncbi:MAG: M3 family metallopeptidase [Promethearchaeota archaeon]